MAEMNRRDLCAAIAGFAAFASLGETLANAQGTAAGAGATLSTSQVFRFSEVTAKPNANGGWGRQILHGTLSTGEFVECHESMLPVGKMPHPPHKHANTEFIMLREGTVQYLSDGKSESVSPGDVIFTASNQPHGMINSGKVNAIYYVVSVGVQPGSTEVTLKPPA